MGSKEVKEYLSHHLVPQLLESLLTGLLYHRPDDPLSFLDRCLMRTRQLGGPESVSWDTFIHLDRDQLRPGPPGTTAITTLLGPTTLPVPPHVSLLPPISPPITPPLTTTFTVAPLTSSIKSNTPVVAPPPVSSGPPKTTRVVHPTPPGPAAALPPPQPPPLVRTEVKDEDASEALSPPGLPRSPVQSQLSIDSDSDMTESSGLLQEVSLLRPQRPRPLIIFIIGGPGSGKGSQTAKLVRCFGLRAISLGDLLRKQLLSHASPSRKWEVISEMMSHGELGPQEETISELRRQLIGQRDVRGFIVDGFPRDVHQALSFQEQIGSPDLVMLLLCSNETLSCRLQQRASRLGLLGDSSHTLRRRLDTFQRDIVSVRRYYSQTHLLTQVDADREEEVVFADLTSVIREKLQLKDQSDPTGIPECISEVHDVQHQI